MNTAVVELDPVKVDPAVEHAREIGPSFFAVTDAALESEDEWTPEKDAAVLAELEQKARETAPDSSTMMAETLESLRQLRSILQQTLDSDREITQKAQNNIRRRIAEITRTEAGVLAIQEGSINLKPVLSRQPSPVQLSAPARREVTLKQAKARMAKSKYMFPDPKLILGSLGLLLGLEMERDIREIELRILHYLAEGHFQKDGMLVSHSLRRLVTMGKLMAKPERTEAEDQQVLAARATVLDFLEDARHGSR
jgi:hypothetical protein